MSENVRDLVIAIVFGLIAASVLYYMVVFRVPAFQPIKSHPMQNGVICYTFNTSIDCVQVDR